MVWRAIQLSDRSEINTDPMLLFGYFFLWWMDVCVMSVCCVWVCACARGLGVTGWHGQRLTVTLRYRLVQSLSSDQTVFRNYLKWPIYIKIHRKPWSFLFLFIFLRNSFWRLNWISHAGLPSWSPLLSLEMGEHTVGTMRLESVTWKSV